MSVVKDTTELDGHELISQSTNVSVQSKSLQIDVRGAQDGGTGRFVTSSGLDTDESILDNIDTAHTVFTSKSVESQEDLNGIGVCVGACGDLDGKTSLKFDGDPFGSDGGIFGSGGKFPHVSWGCGVGVF